MELITPIIIGITATYSFTIFWIIFGFFKVQKNNPINALQIHTFSIIIPFRNEEEYLPKLLESIKKISYSTSKFEVLFVDDFSKDNSVKYIQNLLKNTDLDFQILSNTKTINSPKKKAIETAISVSKFDYIITTDADCILPSLWLQSFDTFLQKSKASLVAAPIDLICNKDFVQQFQAFDLLSLQTATMGSFGWKLPFLCNGANLCYNKQDFFDIDGFKGNSSIASGDDIFLLEKMIKRKKQVNFLYSQTAIVKTHALKTWKDVINQRIRWMSKTKKYQLRRSKIIGFIVFLMNISILLTFLLYLIDYVEIFLTITVFFSKFLIDSCAVLAQNKNHKALKSFSNFLLSFVTYPFITTIVVAKSFTKKYQWKGRSFNN